MKTLDVLENFSRLCDELETAIQAGNRGLRAGEPSDDVSVTTNQAAIERLTAALAELRALAPAEPEPSLAVRDLRDRVAQKLLKLMLLNRESEQLLLKSMAPTRRAPAVASPALLRSVYQGAAA